MIRVVANLPPVSRSRIGSSFQLTCRLRNRNGRSVPNQETARRAAPAGRCASTWRSRIGTLVSSMWGFRQVRMTVLSSVKQRDEVLRYEHAIAVGDELTDL